MVRDRLSEITHPRSESARGRDDRSRSTLIAGFVALVLIVVAVVLGVRRREESGLEPPF